MIAALLHKADGCYGADMTQKPHTELNIFRYVNVLEYVKSTTEYFRNHQYSHRYYFVWTFDKISISITT